LGWGGDGECTGDTEAEAQWWFKGWDPGNGGCWWCCWGEGVVWESFEVGWEVDGDTRDGCVKRVNFPGVELSYFSSKTLRL
jgi:hypothetical protein